MKKIFTKLMLLAVAAAALVSCENKFDEQTPSVELTQTVTLSAEKPTEVRTELIGGVPYWSKNDQIGVYVVDGDGYKNYAFKNDSESEEPSLTTTFTGTTVRANTLFVYYPYTNFNDPVTEKGVKVEILANQEPTAASFDGRSDLMIAKPVQLDAEGKQLSDLEFARVAAIVKIVLKDTTGNLAGQHVSSLTMTAATNLVGRVYLDVINQELGELYNGGAKSVNATYTEATQYEVNGTNATYVIVYPQTLAAGSTLSFEAVTEGYNIKKEIPITADKFPNGIILESGKVTTLNVNLAADNLVKEETGLALPFEDDFSWVGTTSTNAFTSVTNIFPKRGDVEMYSAVATIYPEDNTALKFSSGNAAGSLTTAAIDLSQPFSVVVNAKYHGSDASSLVITVGEVTKTIALTADYADYVVEFDAASAKETITISGTAKSKRFYLNDLKIVAGHDYVLPAVLTVSTAEISGVSHEGEDKTFTYSVTNPVDGVSATVTANVNWIKTAITTVDNNGTVTVTVAANEAEEAREGVVTVTYGDLTKTVTVKQNGKSAEGGSEGGEPTWTLLTNASDLAVGDQIIIASSSANYAISTTQNSNNRGQAAITKSSDKNTLSTPGATVQILTVEAGSTSGSFAFYAAAPSSTVGYLYAAGASSNNYMRTQTTVDDKASWTVSIASTGVATIKCVASISKNWMRYNSSSGIFSCYGSGQGDVVIYKLVGGESGGEGGGSTPETHAPVLAVTSATTINVAAEGDVATVKYNVTNPVSGKSVTASANQTWVNGFDYSTAGEVSFIVDTNTGAARTATVTLKYEGAESKTVTVSQDAGNTGGGETAKVWTLVTDASTLKAGDQIIIAVNSKSATASATISSSYMNVITNTVFSSDKNTITTVGSGTAILTLGGSASAWTLTNESGKQLGTSAAKKVAWGSGTTTWTIAISNKNATIKCTTTSNGWLQYNAQNPRFTTYTSNQTLPQIYRLQ